jgi:hypothetical protein
MIKRISISLLLLLVSDTLSAAQAPISVGSAGDKKSLNTNFANAQANFTELYSMYSNAQIDSLLGLKQTADPDLSIYAGITPSANVQILLGATNYYVMRGLLDLEVGVDFNAYDVDLTTASGANTAGVNKYFGTNSSSAVGFYDLPTGSGSGLTSMPTATNQILQATGVGTYGWTSSIAGLIDDTATNGDADKLWSADHTYDLIAIKQDVDADLTIAAGAGSAGVSKYFGTNSSSAVGFHDLPTGGASTLAGISDWPSTVSSAEVGYLANVTDDIQGQIDALSVGSIPALTADPGSPADGYVWFNTTDHTLNAAQVTGSTKFTGSYTAWDIAPTAFTFTDETDVAVSTAKVSDTKTVAGINHAAPISVTGDNGFGYKKNGSACTSTASTISLGDTFNACVTTSALSLTAATSTVTIGGVSDTYSVTTEAVAISYIAQENWETSGSSGISWSYSGTYNTAYSTSPAPLEGITSLYLDACGGAVDGTATGTFTPVDGKPQEIFMLVKNTAFLTTSTLSAYTLKDSINNTVGLVQFLANDTIQVAVYGGTATNTISTMGTDKTWIWLSYQKGTGANATLSIGFSTDGIRPTSGNNYAISTGGTRATNANKILLMGDYGSGINCISTIYDKLMVSGDAINSNP